MKYKMRADRKRISIYIKRIAGEAGPLFYKLFRLLILSGIAYLMISPVLNYLTIALSNPIALYGEDTIGWLPQDPTFTNFTELLTYFKYFEHAKLTLAYSGISTLLTLVSCSLAGYGLARFRFKGNKIMFALVIITIIVPIQTAQIPMYLNYQKFDFFGIGTLMGWITGTPVTMNLLNTGWVFWLPAMFGMGLRSGLYIFLFRQFFMGMPKDLEDAGRVDGCSKFGIFLRIFVPNTKPVFVTVFLLSMIYYWNDSAVSGMLITSPDVTPLMLYIEGMDLLQYAGVIGLEARDAMEAYAQHYAGLLMVVAPLMILFIICQKYFIESMDRSGIKG